MTAPGDGYGENPHDDEAKPTAAGGSPEQPAAPWEPPAASPAASYPPPAYPPPGYPAGYPPGYATQYPRPPTQYEPPSAGHEQPPGYGAAPYQPGSQFGGPPAGYGPPPPYPGGYYPAPDYHGGYGPPGGVKPGTNTLAIASLISSITGVFCCCLGSIVGIALGAIAIGQIRRTRQDGYGLAVAGIAIGVATLIVTFIVFLFALHSR